MNLPRELAERAAAGPWDWDTDDESKALLVDAIEAVIREAMQLALEAAEQACEKAEGWRSDFDVSRPGIREAIRSLKAATSSLTERETSR